MESQIPYILPQETLDELNEYHGTNYDPRSPGRPPTWFTSMRQDWREYWEDRNSSNIFRDSGRVRSTDQQRGTQGNGEGRSPQYAQKLLEDLGITEMLNIELKDQDTLTELLNQVLDNLVKNPKMLAIVSTLGIAEWKHKSVTAFFSALMAFLQTVTILLQGTETFLKGANNILSNTEKYMQNTGTPIDKIPWYFPGSIGVKVLGTFLHDKGLW